MATRPKRRLTYEDYLHFPEGERWEVIDGGAYMVPSPTRGHQRIAGELHRQVANHLKVHGGGEVYIAPFDVVLEESDVLQPDIVFVSDDDMRVLTEANIWGTPTWVVEVLSPSHPERDRRLKLARYERSGVGEYWICDPAEHTFEIYRLTAGVYRDPIIVRAPDKARPLRPDGLVIDPSEVFTSG